MQSTARRWAYRAHKRYEKRKHQFKRWRGYEPILVEPYITYGTADELWIAGRLLEAKGVQGAPGDSNWRNLVHMLRRYQSEQIPFTDIEIRLGKEVRTVTTDAEGYFHYRWPSPAEAVLNRPWTELILTAADPELPMAIKHSVAEVSLPVESAEFAIISDVDDTIMRTGATSFLRHTKTVLLNNAHSRELFPGTSEFYNALHQGLSGEANNPFFYVSSSPWNIYDLIAEFIAIHQLPKGPVLLKDFGLREDRWFKSGHESYKTDRIAGVLSAYPHLNLVLIGDSGQHDVYAYLSIAKSHPGRVLAVYIRDLKPNSRSKKINASADEFAELGVPFMFVEDAAEAARHARVLRLVTAAAASEVKQDVAIQRAVEAAE